MQKKYIFLAVAMMFGVAIFVSCNRIVQHYQYKEKEIGDKIDSLNGVYVYYNYNVGNVSGRNVSADGYNLGLKYQCVEFVKRYYYIYLDHKMPDSYGHANSFFEKNLGDGKKSKRRNLIQYSNPSSSEPKVNDLLVFDGTKYNKYGHVAIISKVTDSYIEIIQQNPGPSSPSRDTFKLIRIKGKWKIIHDNALGWLRKE